MLSPFCGFGIDAEMLKDYTRVKGLLARGPLKRVAPGIVSYAIAATTTHTPPPMHAGASQRGGAGRVESVGMSGTLHGLPGAFGG